MIMTYPLSQTQLGIHITCLNSREEGNYNINMLYHLDEEIDLQRLAGALDAVIAAHPYVKSRIVNDEEGNPVFEDRRDEEFHTAVRDVQTLDEVKGSFGADFDLMKDRLFRIEIYRTQSEGNYLYVDFHHIIFDGASWSVLCEDLEKAYDGQTLETEAVDGFRIALDEAALRESEFYREAAQWYKNEFGAASELESMPLADIYGNEEEHFTKFWKKLDIDYAALQEFCKRENVKESTVFEAAFGYTLSRFICEDEVLYTTAFHGRSDKAVRKSFNMMVKTLPVYHNFAGMTTVRELFEQIQNQTAGTRKYSVYSFADAHTDLGISTDVSFVYQGPFHNLEVVLNGRRQEGVSLMTHTPGFKFLGMLMIEDGAPYIWCEFQNNKFTPGFIEEFWKSYGLVTGELCVKSALNEIELCTPTQIGGLDRFNEGKGVKIQEETVLEGFKKAVAACPENTAIIYKDKKISYRELDEITDRVGSKIYSLIKDSGKAEPVVSILVGRSELMTILPLAAMKAGCAYQPLDPSYPQERLSFMVNDASAALLIAEPELRELVADYSGGVLLTNDLYGPAGELPSELPGPESLFILLYTSGSTGVPKGVMLEHRNINAFCKWYHKYYDLKPSDHVAAYASFGFDANMMDQYPALTKGSAIVIVPEEIRLDLVALSEYFIANGVTHSFLTTQVGVQFVQNISECDPLKHLSTGGEKLISLDTPQAYDFFNLYGPTECTIITTAFKVEHNEYNIPIGEPVDALKCYVCDKNMHRLPCGAAGELIITGGQVARGYLNRPDKTAEAFFTIDGERAYHSGDIVRYRSDGNIEFVGRRDGQVKIRGFRIELKEVEAIIRDFPGIKDCTVQAYDDINGGKFIAAYVVGENGPVDISALNDFILENKPPYMVPACTMELDRIPLNVNQKVDKKALPKPELKSNAASEAIQAPLNALEQQLKEIISPIIKTEDFSITEPLGYYGLTSITSIKLSVQIFKKYGVQLDSRALAKTGTLQSIENEILLKLLSQDDEVIEEKSAVSSAPLSFTQRGVYAECMANPETVIYNMPMRLSFPAGTSAESVKAAVLEVLEAHPYMYCHFTENSQGEIVQVPIEGFKPEVGTVEMDEDSLEAYSKEFVRPFDLGEGPLFRFEVVRTPETCHLLLDIHHLIGDGASIDLFNQE